MKRVQRVAVREACPAPGLATHARSGGQSLQHLLCGSQGRANRTREGGCLSQGSVPPQPSKLALQTGHLGMMVPFLEPLEQLVLEGLSGSQLHIHLSRYALCASSDPARQRAAPVAEYLTSAQPTPERKAHHLGDSGDRAWLS